MTDWKKEVRDQALHFVAGAGGVLVLSLLIPAWGSALVVAAIAYGREVVQRLMRGDPWYDCGRGCMLDLSFWALGIIFAVLIEVFVL